LPQIDVRLIDKLKKKLSLSRSAVYARIDRTAQQENLPTHLAVLIVAREARVNARRFATPEDLALIRSLGSPAAHQAAPPVPPPASSDASRVRTRGQAKRRAVESRRKNPDTVFVVHGRDSKARQELSHFLTSLEIKVLEWNKAVTLTKKPNPYIGEVIDAGFENSQAIVVLFTPDDEAKLRDKFVNADDPAHERKLTGQPRQNVIFEAGMAMSKYPRTTVLVRLGTVRPMSDVGGLHILHLTDSAVSRKSFVSKLQIAGLVLNDDGDNWLTAGDFSSL
jgi:predicted nucleotide-binding protein